MCHAVEFADAMRKLLEDKGETARHMGAAARRHVESNFSRCAFGNRLDGYVRALAAKR